MTLNDTDEAALISFISQPIIPCPPNTISLHAKARFTKGVPGR